jgi:beta-phosphoglucomutase
MDWIHQFQLFLFDFDGLLVDTERLHFQAYIDMMKTQGFSLSWSFPRYCSVAHLHATALKEALYAEFPTLSPNWDLLYAQKKKNYLALISSGKAELLPGAEKLLQALRSSNVRHCVVTNSFREQTDIIASHLPALQTIPLWITRENYQKQKPDPEPYLTAIHQLGRPGDRIIGFEDTIRGLSALQGTSATPVLIGPCAHPAPPGILHFPSLEEIKF